MNKKLLSMALSLVMMLGTFTSVFAADTKTSDKKEETKKAEEVKKVVGKANKVQYLVDHKIVEGNEKGELELNNPIKRSEITKILVYANGNKKLAEQLQGTMQIYTDVTPSFWANGVITVGTTVPSDSNKQAMLNGYPDRSFKPENNVTYAEAAKMLVVLAKKDLTADMVKEANKNWAAQWMTWAAELGILNDVDVKDSNAAATREDVFTMMYNALYAMKNIKNEASNEKVGVLSKLNKDVLVLNQDAKENEYKITDNTVYVDENFNEVKSGYLKKVKAISNPEYYLGSLVRVLVNDKKEVTHILELGNPEDGALYNKDKNDKDINKDNGCIIVKDNERWNGLADDTISTEMLNDKDLNDLENNKNLDKSFVKFVYNDDGTEVKHLKFFGDNAGKVTDAKTAKNYVKELKVKDSTKVYVADQRNNNLKEVKDMDEAISLLGYKDVNKNIYSVYAGYDDESLTTAQNSKFEEGTAKYVVFNVTNKDNNIDDNYRIETVPGNNGSATLLNTDNELVDEDFFKFTNLFPLSTFKQYDVVKIKVGSDGKAKAYRELEHSETDDYPIVKITKVKKDGKVLEVEGEDYKTVIFVDDADLFGKSSLSKLEKGDIVQLKLNEKDTKEENKNVIDIVSVLKDEKVEGKLKKAGFIKVVQDNGYIGTLLSVGKKSVVMNTTSLIDNKDTSTNKEYAVDEYVANALRGLLAKGYKEVKFITQDDVASDFYVNISVNGKAHWTKVLPLSEAKDEQKHAEKIAARAGLEVAINEAKALNAEGAALAGQLTEAITTAQQALNAPDATTETLTEATTTLNNTVAAAQAVQTAKTAVEKVEVNPVTWTTDENTTQGAVQTAVQTAVNALKLQGVDFKYEVGQITEPQNEQTSTAKVTVTITSTAQNSENQQPLAKGTATVNVTVNAAK